MAFSWASKLVYEKVFGSDDLDLGSLAEKEPEYSCLLASDIYVYHGKWGE